MTDHHAPKEPFDPDRDSDAALDPDLNDDLIDSAEADQLAAEGRAEANDGYDDGQMEDTKPVTPPD